MTRSASFQKILHFLYSSGFLKVSEGRVKHPQVSFLPNGGLLRQNLINEWYLSRIVTKDQISMVSRSDALNSASPSSSKVNADSYPAALLISNDKLPLGYGSVTCCRLDDIIEPPTWFNNPGPREFTELRIQYYVEPADVRDYLTQLEVDHLMWWKMLSSSKSLSSSRIDSSSTSTSVITYSHNELGDCTVESLEVSEPIAELQHTPCVIQSVVNCDIATTALLMDAYREREGKQILRFHPRLAPYKLGLVVHGENHEELQTLADYIKSELKKEAILLYDYSSTKEDVIIDRLQELGVPLALQLTDESLLNGVIYLQDLSAKTKEPIHVTNIQTRILKYVRSM